MALRRSLLQLAVMALAMSLAFLYGCQDDKRAGSGSPETTAQGQDAGGARQPQGGDHGEAQGELGPKVSKIMNHS